MELTDIKREYSNLVHSYNLELERLEEKVQDTRRNLRLRSQISDHDAFNMSAVCQNLAVMAGKIEQTANVIRWMETAEKDASLAASLKACTGAVAVTVKTVEVK